MLHYQLSINLIVGDIILYIQLGDNKYEYLNIMNIMNIEKDTFFFSYLCYSLVDLSPFCVYTSP